MSQGSEGKFSQLLNLLWFIDDMMCRIQQSSKHSHLSCYLLFCQEKQKHFWSMLAMDFESTCKNLKVCLCGAELDCASFPLMAILIRKSQNQSLPYIWMDEVTSYAPLTSPCLCNPLKHKLSEDKSWLIRAKYDRGFSGN